MAMCPALGSPGKSAVIRHTLSGFSRGRSLPSSSRTGSLSATAVAGADAAFIAGPAGKQARLQQAVTHLQHTNPWSLSAAHACQNALSQVSFGRCEDQMQLFDKRSHLQGRAQACGLDWQALAQTQQQSPRRLGLVLSGPPTA